VRDLIQRMSRDNPLWGASRIHGELLMLGFEVAQSKVSKYMVRGRRPPSQSWKTFLRNHANAIAAIDLCVVQNLSAYAAFCSRTRTYLALQRDAPMQRAIQKTGTINAVPILGGLHHEYVRI
jgi:hypothetical protein